MIYSMLYNKSTTKVSTTVMASPTYSSMPKIFIQFRMFSKIQSHNQEIPPILCYNYSVYLCFTYINQRLMLTIICALLIKPRIGITTYTCVYINFCGSKILLVHIHTILFYPSGSLQLPLLSKLIT